MSDGEKTLLRLCPRRLALGLGLLGILGVIGSGCGFEPPKSVNPALQATGSAEPRAAPILPGAGPAVSPVVGTVAPPAAPTTSPDKSELAMVLGSAVNVRPSAGTAGAPLGRIHCGDLVAVRGREGDWLQIQLKELSGYAHSAYLVEVKAGQGTRPTCEFAHRGITPPHNKKPEKMPSGPSPNTQVPHNKTDTKKANPEDFAVAPAAPPPAPATPAAPGAPAAATDPAVAAPPVAKPPVTASGGSQPQLVWLSTHGIKPKVMFPHPHHAQMFACAKCHHPLGSPGPNKDKDCHSCHIAGGKGQSPVSNKDAFHQTCRACHEATGRGPTACQDCHNGGK